MIKNMIGLEAEFLLRNSKGELLFPGNCGFSTDEFIILGEFRSLPGTTRAETIANFFKDYYETLEKAKKDNRSLDLKGWAEIDPKFYSEIMKKMGTKVISESRNIYELDLLTLSDAVVEDGNLKCHKISTGLHIHFSSCETNESRFKYEVYDKSKIKLPLSVNGTQISEIEFDRIDNVKEIEKTISATASRITKPVLNYIIKEFDDKILPNYKIDTPLKYRNAGFYELKSWGFEYRSLPFNDLVLQDIYNIVDFAYTKLEELNL